jgi:glycopeptide antibiotics resistance protein
VARSRLAYPLLGTLTYMLIVAVVLVVPVSAPHARRGYLTEYQIVAGRRLVADVVVNIAMFAPIGWGLHRTGRALRVSPQALILVATVVAMLFSLMMEALQLWLPARYSSIMDVVANSVGAVIGAWSEHRYASRA